MAVSTLSFREYLSQLSGRRLGAFKSAAAKQGITLEKYIEYAEAGQKACVDCRLWRDRGEFNQDQSRWDGLNSKCRECQNKRDRDSHVPLEASELSRMGPARKIVVGDDKKTARHLVNLDVKQGRRPDPNSLFCAKCGHKGNEYRHEYHHHMGYSAEHVYDVVVLCSLCHHEEHAELVSGRARHGDGTFAENSKE